MLSGVGKPFSEYSQQQRKVLAGTVTECKKLWIQFVEERLLLAKHDT
jgi:hypothetical protein